MIQTGSINKKSVFFRVLSDDQIEDIKRAAEAVQPIAIAHHGGVTGRGLGLWRRHQQLRKLEHSYLYK